MDSRCFYEADIWMYQPGDGNWMILYSGEVMLIRDDYAVGSIG